MYKAIPTAKEFYRTYQGWITTKMIEFAKLHAIAHDIVDIAGAKHCGPGTHWQVLKCLISSPYWEHSLWYINGWRNRRANCYHPSDIGKKYYEQKLKSHKYSSNLKDL